MDRILLVSADGHSGGPPEVYRDYLEARYQPDLEALIAVDREWRANSIMMSRFTSETLDVIDRDGAIRGDGELGAWEMDRRLVELDREGVAAEVLIPGHQVSMLPFFAHINAPFPVEMRIAGARAYHRQLADQMAGAGGRLVAIAEPGPCIDMDAAVRELEWLAGNGFVGVAPPGNVADPALGLPPITDSYYEPFWSAVADLGLTLTIHAAYGLPQIDRVALGRTSMMEDLDDESRLRAGRTADVSIDQFPPDSPARMALTVPRRVVWQLMMAGVLDRHPSLQLVLTEVRADWVPGLLEVLETHFAHSRVKLRRSPSEYWADHMYVAPSSPRPYEVAMRDRIGVERFLFGMDYPHPEGTWPNTKEWIRHAFAGVPEADARMILGDNAVRAYHLDADRLRSIAERIGPEPDDLLGQHELNERVIANFHDRSGYMRPPEVVQADFYETMLMEDEGLVQAAASS